MKRNPHPRTLRLRQLMADHQLTARRVSEIVNRRPHTVECWRSEPQVIPATCLDLLELKLQPGVSNDT